MRVRCSALPHLQPLLSIWIVGIPLALARARRFDANILEAMVERRRSWRAQRAKPHAKGEIMEGEYDGRWWMDGEEL